MGEKNKEERRECKSCIKAGLISKTLQPNGIFVPGFVALAKMFRTKCTADTIEFGKKQSYSSMW
jgi:hypothetical protein